MSTLQPETAQWAAWSACPQLSNPDAAKQPSCCQATLILGNIILGTAVLPGESGSCCTSLRARAHTHTQTEKESHAYHYPWPLHPATQLVMIHLFLSHTCLHPALHAACWHSLLQYHIPHLPPYTHATLCARHQHLPRTASTWKCRHNDMHTKKREAHIPKPKLQLAVACVPLPPPGYAVGD